MAESTEGKLNVAVALALEGFPLPEGGNAPLNNNNDTDLILCLNTETKRIDTVSKASITSGGTVPTLQNVMTQGSTATVTTETTIETNAGLNLLGGSSTTNITGGGYGFLMNSANEGIRVTGGGDFKGLYYGADYSAYYTDRSLVDKEYVDDAVGGGIQDLDSVLSQGNTSATSVVITNGTLTSTVQSGNVQVENTSYRTNIKGGLVSFTSLDTEFTADIAPSDILVDGARFLLPSVSSADDFVLPIKFNVNGGSEVTADENGLVELVVSGTGNAERLVKTESGNTNTLEFKSPITENGVTFYLPSTTTPDDKVLVTHVNQVPANDGGVVELGLQQILSYDAYAEDVQITLADAVTSLGTTIQGGQIVVGSSTEINEFGVQVLGGSGALGTLQRKDYFQFGATTENTKLTAETPTGENILVFPNKSGTIATLDDVTGGVTGVFGTNNEINVADGANEPVISISPAYTTARNNYADAKVENNLTASTTVAPSKTAVNTAISSKANDAEVVKLTGDQTIAGFKKFTNMLTVETTDAPLLLDRSTTSTGAIQVGRFNVSRASLPDGLGPFNTYSLNNTNIGSMGFVRNGANNSGRFVVNVFNTGSFLEALSIDRLGATTVTNDIEVNTANKGVILKSPNGTRFRVTVSDAGVLTTTSI